LYFLVIAAGGIKVIERLGPPIPTYKKSRKMMHQFVYGDIKHDDEVKSDTVIPGDFKMYHRLFLNSSNLDDM